MKAKVGGEWQLVASSSGGKCIMCKQRKVTKVGWSQPYGYSKGKPKKLRLIGLCEGCYKERLGATRAFRRLYINRPVRYVQKVPVLTN